MQQKSPLDKSSREISFLAALTLLTVLLFYFFAQPFDNNFNTGFSKSWFFFLSWYNYYDFFFSSTITDLNLLREIYFYNNSFEFVLINFLLFYGIITSILLTFFIKRIFAFSNFTQFKNLKMRELPNSTYFIRSQDFLKQQATSTGTRVWLKKKQSKPYDN